MSVVGTNEGITYDGRSLIAVVSVYPKRGKSKEPRYLTDRVESVEYVDSGKRRTTRLKVTLDNSDEALFSDPDLMRKGTVLGLRFGYPGLMVNAGQFVVKEIRGNNRELTVEGSERKRSRMARKRFTRVWEDKTRSQVVTQILTDPAHGFDRSQVFVDDTSTVFPTISQHNEHDWAFLYRLAKLQAFEFYIDAKGIHWEKPRRNKKPSRLLRFIKNPVGVGEIVGYDFETTAAGIPGRVVMKGYDSALGQAYDVAVDESDSETELFDLVDADSLDSPYEGDATDRGDTGYDIVQNIGARSRAEAKKLAQALFTEISYSVLNLKLTCIGDPTVRSRTVIVVWGIGPAIDGLYWVKKATHSFTGSGYETKVELTRKGLAKRLKLRRGQVKWSWWHEWRQIKREGSKRQYYGQRFD